MGRDRELRARLSRARQSRERRSRARVVCVSLGARESAGHGRGYVAIELTCVGLYGWLELRNTVYTLSTLLSFSKNGIKSNSSESVMSSNHDATGTCNVNHFILTSIVFKYRACVQNGRQGKLTQGHKNCF